MRQRLISTIGLLLLAVGLQAQNVLPPTPLTLVSPDGRRTIPTTVIDGRELVALDDVAMLFQVTLREDTLAGGMTLTYGDRTIVVSVNQPMASVDGRVVALPSPIVRQDGDWFVPLEFFPRALAPLYGPMTLRAPSRLLLVGDVRVPRVVGRIEVVGNTTRATIEVTPAVPVTTQSTDGQIALNVEADALDLALPADGAGLIDRIRAGDGPLTVAVLTASDADTPRTTTATIGNITRVTIDVSPRAVAGAAPPPAGAAPPPAGGPAPIPTSRPAIQTIVLDPGHGGDDVGVRGAGGIEEKQITLEIARRLRTLIESRLGVRVILTRDDDRPVGLDGRAAVANNNKADLFLSLHLNAAPTGASSGAEVSYVRLDEEGEAARGAAQAASVSLPVLGGASRPIEIIRWDLAQAPHVDASAVLAATLEEELRQRVPMGRRPLQQGPVRVLMGANMPAALIEMAYLTNAEQERTAQSEAFQDAAAQSIFSAIVRFRGYLENGVSP